MKWWYPILTLTILQIAWGCSSSSVIPGTGGKTSAQRIEKTSHPPIPEGVTCYVCHKEDLPTHEFHAKFGRDCSQCHVTSTWMAAKYPHTAWPLDDNHNTRCTFCHVNLSAFDFTYQCWGCHHKEAETKKTHKDRNIDDITNCVACHKTTVKQ